jgi:excisionase family DNA binding protein
MTNDSAARSAAEPISPDARRSTDDAISLEWPFADEESPNALPHLLTPDEVASYLRIPRRTVDGWRQVRTGPPFVRLGRAIRYSAPELLKWIATLTENGPHESEVLDS